MAWGGVIGVLVGIMVGIYALPPILKSIYGVEQVRYGETYEDDGRTLRVLSVTGIEREPDGAIEVVIAPTATEPWEIPVEDFELELADGERLEILGEPPEGAIMDAGASEQFVLVFDRAPGQDAEPVYLHLSSPRVRFDLLPTEPDQ